MEEIRLITKVNGIPYSIRRTRDRIFSPKEWELFISSLKTDKIHIFDFLINTGARINEALNVTTNDIDFNNNTILLRMTKRRSKFSDGKPRLIKISSQYAIRLKNYVNSIESNVLFDITKQAVYQLMRRTLKKAEFKDWQQFSLHNIRKTSESWLCFLGVHPFLILKRYGHNQSTAVNYYIQSDIYDSKYKFQARQIIGDLMM